MGNSNFIGTTIPTAPHAWRRHLHRGWVDAQNGTKWAADYDKMNISEQIAYETGRLFVREAIAEGFPLCIWRGDKAGSVPVQSLWNDVCRKLGRSVTPATWEPA